MLELSNNQPKTERKRRNTMFNRTLNREDFRLLVAATAKPKSDDVMDISDVVRQELLAFFPRKNRAFARVVFPGRTSKPGERALA